MARFIRYLVIGGFGHKKKKGWVLVYHYGRNQGRQSEHSSAAMAKVQLSTRKGEDEFGGTISQAYTGKKAKNWEKQIYRGRRTKSTLGEIGTPRASRGMVGAFMICVGFVVFCS